MRMLFLILILLIFIVYPQRGETKENNERLVKAINVEKEYSELKKSLDLHRPGYGKSDYGDYETVDIPKAYAMLLSAELMKYRSSNGNYNLSVGLNSGNWLLNNSDLNGDGVLGWGVPVAWDAFGDNSINPENTEYTIATGIVINSLMDWLDLSPKTAPKEKILNTIKEVIKPYLKEEIFSKSGLYNYSLLETDRKFNCFNAATYMAGKMQRFTNFISDTDLKNRIKVSVDRVMTAALQYKKIDKMGGWYWSYSLEENNVPNDLAHACYTIDGIMTYVQSNGTLKKLFDTSCILKHINYFSDNTGGEYYLFPSFYRKDRTPRIYGLGIFLYVHSKYIKNTSKITALLNYFKRYKLPNGLYSRYQNENIVITEYIAYMMYGLASSCFYNNKYDQLIHLHSDNAHQNKINNIFEHTELDNVTEIPFTLLKERDISVLFNISKFSPEVSVGGKVFKLNKYKAVPVKLLFIPNKTIIILRELLTNTLIIASFDKDNEEISYKKIEKQSKTFYDFREATIFNNQLVVIAYEGDKRQNTLLTFSLSNKLHRISEHKLPSIEYPSGGNYECVPKMQLLKSSDNKYLYILSGRLFGFYDGNSFRQLPVDSSIKIFTEAIITDKGEVFSLYLNKENRYAISNLTKNSIYYTASIGEVIFELNYYYNKVQFKKLSSTNDLKELILNDFFNNKGSGTLYLGTNNIEGRLAWSQIYYLNGMLSFLELAQEDIEFYEKMKDFVPLIKKRLDLEIKLFLYQMNSPDSLRCRVFSIDRSLQLFAVQSSRFGLLLHRYLKLFPDKNLIKQYEILKKNITLLRNHMEILEQGVSNVVSKRWNPNNSYYLKWPQGSPFIFDGLPVPYNHQNEWATFILSTNNDICYVNIAESIIRLFLGNVADEKGNLPYDTRWPYWGEENESVWWYWWGKAWEGWNKEENVSTYSKSYIGDKIVSATSFKTIDAISVLSLYEKLRKPSDKKYTFQIKKMIQEGYVFPYVSSKMLPLNNIPVLSKKTMSEYIRFNAPWEFDNNVWSYLTFIKFYSSSEDVSGGFGIKTQ